MAKHGNSKQAAALERKARARNLHIMKILSLIIALAGAFCVGFFVRGDAGILSAVGLESMAGVSSSASSAGESRTAYTSLSLRMEEVEDLLVDESIDTFDLEVVTEDMLDALAAATNDPYLQYYTQSEYALLEQASGEGFEGIGVLFGEANSMAYAVDVFDGSAAQAAGVQEGDFVVAIDGDRSRTWSQAEVVAALDREDGSSVVVTWRRPESVGASGGEEFTTSLTCASSSEVNVTTELDENGVGTITLRQITSHAADLVRDAVTDLEGQGANVLVLDIRDNPGGYLTQAVEIANLFVRSGTLVQIETNDGINSRQANGEVLTDAPLVVLVNGNTASAAEVLAAALQDNQRATLVGQTTLGKGTVQVVRQLSFGGALRYTAANYLSPQGRQINDLGVTPDIAVAARDDGADNQLLLAREAASSLAGV